MRPIYVHIGTHKTGTTSIQSFLRHHADTLGVYVPKAGRIANGGGHHNIGWGLRGDRRFNPKFGSIRDLAAELTAVTHPSAVISAEGLEFLVERPDLIARFEAHLFAAGWQPHYIVVFRQPHDYAPSLHHEQSHLGRSYARFAWEILRTGKVVGREDRCCYFDYPAFVRRWTDAARGPLTALRYDPTGMVPAFLKAIGVTDAKLIDAAKDAPRLNARPNKPKHEWWGVLLRLRFPRSYGL